MHTITRFLDSFLDRYPSAERLGVPVARWRQSIYRLVFDPRTPMGRKFERYLTLAIVCSLLAMMAHSTPEVATSWLVYPLRVLEVAFTLAFTVEYALRLISVRKPWRYVLSFYGIVDLLAIVPTYLAIVYQEATFFAAIRALRLIRTFHVFPLLRGFLHEYQVLARALAGSARKIFVFLSVVALIVFVMGTLIFIIEGPEHGFTSVPTGIYWAISTVTTVGYGDLTPGTPLGRVFASIMMLLGWGILAVPTGLVGVELSRSAFQQHASRTPQPAPDALLLCSRCALAEHAHDARFCRHCGAPLTTLQALVQRAAHAESAAAAAAAAAQSPANAAEAAPDCPPAPATAAPPHPSLQTTPPAPERS